MLISRRRGIHLKNVYGYNIHRRATIDSMCFCIGNWVSIISTFQGIVPTDRISREMRTTACKSNGMMASEMASNAQTNYVTKELPSILLGLWTALEEDICASLAEIVDQLDCVWIFSRPHSSQMRLKNNISPTSDRYRCQHPDSTKVLGSNKLTNCSTVYLLVISRHTQNQSILW